MKTITVYGVEATYRNHREYEDFNEYSIIMSIHPSLEEAKNEISYMTIERLQNDCCDVYEAFRRLGDAILSGKKINLNEFMSIEDINEDFDGHKLEQRIITFNPNGDSWHKFDIILMVKEIPMIFSYDDSIEAFKEALD